MRKAAILPMAAVMMLRSLLQAKEYPAAQAATIERGLNLAL